MSKICHVSFSSSGGAGRVASQLIAGLPKFGFDARLEVVTDTDIPGIIRNHPIVAGSAVIDNFVVKRRSYHQLFSLTRRAPKSSRDRFCADDLLHLHWIPGALQISDKVLTRSPKPIVWTMHDMWPITGGCHHALECSRYSHGCLNCPAVQPVFHSAVWRAAETKKVVLQNIPRLVICTPSRWLARQVAESSIAHDLDVRYVPNPIDPEFQIATENTSGPSTELCQQLKLIPDDAFVIGFVAKNLDDPNKRLDLVIRTLQGMREAAYSRKIVLLAIGSSRQSKRQWGVDIRWTGTLHSVADRKLAYQRMNVMLSVSDAETAPLVIDEALACGTPVVVRDSGGAAESVKDGYTGIVCKSTDQLRLAVSRLYNDESMRLRMSELAQHDQSHRLANVVGIYAGIYSELISD